MINLDFSKLNNKTAENLEESLINALDNIAISYSLKIEGNLLQTKYTRLITQLTKLKEKDDSYEPKVVLLIDEYDSKLVHLDWGSQQYNDCIKVLKDFLTVVKSCANDCQLIFMTSVTRFSLTDLGSGANIFQGNDISINDVFADVAGYKEEDIRRLFKDELALICKLRASETGSKISSKTVMQDIKDYYNGYKFSKKDLNVFNPSSILSFFQTGSLEGYWYRTGDPSILLKQMQDNIERLNLSWDKLRFDVTKDDIMVTKSRKALTLEALMYQTGYLTIDKYDPSTKKYFLKFPNKEVRDSFSKNIEEIILEEQEAIGKEDNQHVLTALNEENWPKLLQLFRDSCFANASYEALKDEEKSFQHILHSFLNGACHHTVVDHICA